MDFHDSLALYVEVEEEQAVTLNSLSNSLLEQEDYKDTERRAVEWRPLLLDLCARWLDIGSGQERKVLKALGLLVGAFGELVGIAKEFIRNRPHISLFFSDDDQEQEGQLVALYRLLLARAVPQDIYSSLLRPLAQLITNTSLPTIKPKSRWLAIRCFAHITAMPQSERVKLEDQHSEGEWVWAALEDRRVQLLKRAIETTPCRFHDERTWKEDDLHPRIRDVCGVLLFSSRAKTTTGLVITPEITPALRSLALLLSTPAPSPPTLLTGSPKSLLISHLCSSSQLPIHIHLSDTSLDPKALLGNYASSATRPGTFEWVDGVLVKAMREGQWVVLRDIDRASSEVLGVLLPLIESGGTRLGDVEASEGFRLFGTSTASEGSWSFLGWQHWVYVHIPAPTPSSIQLIVSSLYPKLAGAPLEDLSAIWFSSSFDALPKTRSLGLRDLLKWVRRVDALFTGCEWTNMALKEEVLIEAMDCFVGWVKGDRDEGGAVERWAVQIGTVLGVSEERVRFNLTSRTPTYARSQTHLQIGHTTIAIPSTSSPSPALSTSNYTLTKPSLTLLSRLLSSTIHTEPVLLVGETGTGKTTSISHLASIILPPSHPLIVINLSQQSSSEDLMGGWKPVDARVPASELMARWEALFARTFSTKRNEAFLEGVRKASRLGRWTGVVKGWKEGVQRAGSKRHEPNATADNMEGGRKSKRRKTNTTDSQQDQGSLWGDWDAFALDVRTFEIQHVLPSSSASSGKGKFVFKFVEGLLVKAVRHGYWVLLDEINLASSETLEAIHPLLPPSTSITLPDTGLTVPIHPSFRLFASMNPATDVGKRDLLPTLRAKFTEFWVDPPDADTEALLGIVKGYVENLGLGGATEGEIVTFYKGVRVMEAKREVVDRQGNRPVFSMRTLARSLVWCREAVAGFGWNVRRSLWEGIEMGFLTTLDSKSEVLVRALAERTILRGVKDPQSLLSSVPPSPFPPSNYVQVGPFYLARGPLALPASSSQSSYILTPSVQANLLSLARILLTNAKYPVLIEGPTSAGKTSSIAYLAKHTGHAFVRVNNHEHTDVSEYLGTYRSNPTTGKLEWADGVLVRAMKQGAWIVLDELNLAPTEVVEALNRLLDENREIVVPETGETVKPVLGFALFATQNPGGGKNGYGGRKVLSRALRNRFLEVQFGGVPTGEVVQILEGVDGGVPRSRAEVIVKVYEELGKRRQVGRVFERREGFVTLRDLFRWTNRLTATGDMTMESVARVGWMLLGERARREDDRSVVREVFWDVLKVQVGSDESLYLPPSLSPPPTPSSTQNLYPASFIWTPTFTRLFTLLSFALTAGESVLLVGETGTGKTSACQLAGAMMGRELVTLSCHQNTETGDLVGSMRPSRKGGPALFEWQDGPLISAMRSGAILLIDEIALADDSVLERLNSVLEPPNREITLVENDGEVVRAHENFRVVATMNPGGDYGKKELSPALRNRFTEVWIGGEGWRSVLQGMDIVGGEEMKDKLSQFVEWVEETAFGAAARAGGNGEKGVGLRDILAWLEFSKKCKENALDEGMSDGYIFHHAARMTILDGLASFPQTSSLSPAALAQLELAATAKLHELVPLNTSAFSNKTPGYTSTHFHVGPFGIPLGPIPIPSSSSFTLDAPTTRDNAMRVLRAAQLSKPILLEGAPGVGKTALISALASLTGHTLHRINLSDQTDLVDLFGADLPSEGGFAWRDASFLTALKRGEWVLLDEMNLASQSVLEGLNAVLDHRGTVFVPELGTEFTKHPEFRVFAAQNPLGQGGGRKGLPKSFLNRFTKVWVGELGVGDYEVVCARQDGVEADVVRKVIKFSARLHMEVVVKSAFGRDGAPWEFNLRDILRLTTFVKGSIGLEKDSSAVGKVADYVKSVYVSRFRSREDKARVWSIFAEEFGHARDWNVEMEERPHISISPSYFQVGHFVAERAASSLPPFSTVTHSDVLRSHLPALEAIADALQHASLIIISGKMGTGKTTLVRQVAAMFGVKLTEMGMHPAVDTSDIIGGFEQVVEGDVRWKNNKDGVKGYGDSEGPTRILQAEVDAMDVDDIGPSETSTDLPASSGARFEWVDGQLVTALRQGHWLLLDNANLCSPSVLDRLNSLCEAGGTLTLNEKTEAEVVRPHRNFRLFMCVDPRRGELSRAMRNRGVEVAVVAEAELDEEAEVSAMREGMKRGICSPKDRVKKSSIPKGLSPTFDSGSHYLLRMMQLLDAVRPSSTIQGFAMMEYISRSATPQQVHLGALQGIIASVVGLIDIVFPLPSMTTMLGDGLKSLLNCRQACKSIPDDFMKSQPIDLLLNPNLGVRSPSVMRLIEMLVSSSLSASIPNERTLPSVLVKSRDMNQKGLLMDDAPKGLKELYPLVNAIDTYILSVLKHPGDIIASASIQFLNALDLLNAFNCHLKHVTSHSTEFDYSAVTTVLEWIEGVCAIVPSAVGVPVDELKKAVALRSGQGMTRIWQLRLRHVLGDSETRRLVGELAALIGMLRNGEEMIGARRNATQLLTIVGMGRLDEADAAAEVKQTIELVRMIASRSEGDGEKDEPCATDALEVAILGASFVAQSSQDWDRKAMSNMLSLALSSPAYPISGLTSWQEWLWVTEVTSESSKAASSHLAVVDSWLRSLWDIRGHHTSGPAVLMKPSLTERALAEYDWSNVSLADLASYEARLTRQSKFTRTTLCAPIMERVSSLLGVLCDTVSWVLHAYQASFEPEKLRAGLQALNSWRRTVTSSNLTTTTPAPAFILDLQRSGTDDIFIAALSDFFGRFVKLPHAPNRVSAISKAFICLGQALIRLYLPDSPIDPIVAQRCAADFWQRRKEMLDARADVNQTAEALLTGNKSNASLRDISARIEQAEKELQAVGSVQIHRQPDLRRLHALHTELAQFCSDVLGETQVNSLVKYIAQDAERGKLREEVVQGSVIGFLQRLDTAYADLEDITRPLVHAIELVRFGLRCLVSDSESVADVTGQAAAALSIFPSILTHQALSSLDLSEVVKDTLPRIKPAHWLVLDLSTIQYDIQATGDRKAHLRTIIGRYDQLLRLWMADRELEKKAAAEANSLYRQRKQHEMSLSDEELEEREFNRLFPKYQEGEENPTDEEETTASSDRGLSPEMHKIVSDIHFSLFDPSFSRIEDQNTRLQLLNRVISLPHAPSSLDENGACFRLDLITRRLLSLHQSSPADVTDFYRDPNVPEAAKMVNLLGGFISRIEALLHDWPGQMILVNLRDKARDILKMGIHSPVAQLLSSLERLLLQTEDWERYAHKGNSLSAEQHAISGRIVEWRRLELSCWSKLLEAQARSFERSMDEWWFRLYESLILATSTLAAEGAPTEDIEKHFDELSVLLDQFVQRSQLGHFDRRLQLLASFASLVQDLTDIKTAAEAEFFRRLGDLLSNTHAYWSQFSSVVSLHVAKEKEPLEKNIRDFIKLASWKDINVRALKASAEKTHRQLHTCIRKFRAILQQPVEPVLAAFATIPSPTDKQALPASVAELNLQSDVNPGSSVPLKRLSEVVRSTIRPFTSRPLASPLDQMAVDIIASADELANTAILQKDKDVKAKAVKELVGRKRRAVADVLKELRDRGLPHNLKPELLARQQSRAAVMSLPAPPGGPEQPFAEDLAKVEDYHQRLNHLLPLLRQSLNKHSDDISTRELQRAVMFVESAFALALNSRDRIAHSLPLYKKIANTSRRLRDLASSTAVARLQDPALLICSVLARLAAAISEILEAAERLGTEALSHLPPNIQEIQRCIESTWRKVEQLGRRTKLTQPALLTHDELSVLKSAEETLRDASHALRSWIAERPQAAHLLGPTLRWLDKQSFSSISAELPAGTSPTIAPLTNAVLVIVQNLLAQAQAIASEEPDDFIRQYDRSLHTIAEVCRPGTICHISGELLQSSNLGQVDLGLASSFLEQYTVILGDHLQQFSSWCRASYKLAFILGSVAKTIAEKGFCKPQETDEGDAGQAGGEKLEDGTGLGSGEGQENVSEQIEDESQVEGLQGEEEQPRDKNGREDEGDDDKAIEMSNNFEGDLEDVDGKDDGASDGEGDDEAEPEDQVENLDPLDPNAVDEKMWGDEKGPDDSKDSKESDETREGKPSDGDSEMVGKDEDKPQRKPKESDQQGDGAEMEEAEDGEDEEQGPDLDNAAPDLGAKMDDHVQEGDALDLPEDMKLDGEGDDEDHGEDGMEIADDLADEDMQEEDVPDDGEKRLDDIDEHGSQVDDDMRKGVDPDDGESEDQRPDETPDAAPVPDAERISAGENVSTNAEEGGEAPDGTAGGPAGVSKGESSTDRQEKTADEQDLAPSPTAVGDSGQNDQDMSSGEANGRQQLAEGDASTGPAEYQPIPNPVRRLGDAMKEIRRRFQEIAEPTAGDEGDDQVKDAKPQDDAQLEYLQDDEDSNDLQALGPAGPEEATKLRDLRISDDQPGGAPPVEDIEMGEEPSPAEPSQYQKWTGPDTKDSDQLDIEQAVTEDKVRGEANLNVVDEDVEDSSLQPSQIERSTEAQQELDAQVELELRQWVAEGQPAEDAEAIWRRYELLTQDLSSHLCEQLRLILEPTLATRLKGDYRTGKRLNMKKIIPYIASEFTKDKIWLRRTRPSQREYQVLIALDDSKSMAESHSIHLAYETLALVTKALSRLEVGDVGVVKFGKTVDVLHGFDQGTPFSDAVGAKAIQAFHFDQTATDVFALLETSIRVLSNAREQRASSSSSSAGELWQLEIIISDGICQDHERLRTLLRRAQDQRIMIVFVIVDSLRRQQGATTGGKENSILSMNQVSYKNINGRMELQMERYLDTFPFEYYVVLRSVEALPDVLAGTLKQFFERVSGD